jgi:type I restriction enzyme S subunit
MSKKMKLIPELRFPEFEKDGEWRFRQLGEIANVVASGDLDKSSFSFEPTDEHIFPIYSNSISNEGLYGYNTYAKYQPNSITITARGTLGVAFVRHTEFVGIGRLLVVSELEDIDPIYLKENWNHYARVPLENGGIPQLTAIKAKRVSLIFPKFKEQQKIASCLTSLDEMIAAHNDKLEALKDHKKGLMQNLFPQEGQKVPNYRFPEFVKDGEWGIKQVDEYFDVGSSKRVLQKDWTNKGVPFYRTRELVSLSKNEPFGSEIYISESLYSELKKKYGVPSEGDFLVSGVGTLGISYQVKESDKFYFKDGNVLWFELKGDLNSSYFKFCFESEHLQNQINAQTSKSTVGTYTIQNAKKTEFWYPPKPQEQQKIASCLSALDELITAQSEKIEQLQQHKKGLMQGLFPKIES